MAPGEASASSPPARLGEPGLVIDGRYRLEQLLGAGGFGEVWKARQEVEGSEVRPVALKLLYAPDTADGGSSSLGSTGSGSSGSLGGHRWLDEVRAVREVRCKSVATIYDVGISRQPRVAFIAMELLRGETLDERLHRGPVYWRRAFTIGREVATALVACHSVDVTHCDLKPQNIFLDGAGEVFVLDFGVAAMGAVTDWQRRRRTVAPAGAPPADGAVFDMAATGAVDLDELPEAPSGDGVIQLFGTPGYIAPESYRGEEPGPASDSFALGVVLYRMIAGRLPHRLPVDVERPSGPTTMDIRKRAPRGPEATLDSGAGGAQRLAPATPGSSRSRGQEAERRLAAINTATVRNEMIPLVDLVPDVPPAVAALIARLLAPEPELRPTAELLAVFDEVLRRPYGVPDPPYVGLESFDERRAGYIAGRDADIDEVAAKLRDHRAVVLCGPSGCGKSSLAIAGVASRIDRELMLGVDGWRLAVLRPSEGGAVLHAGAPVASGGASDGTGLLVVVDQLEEVVRLAEDERVAFCSALATLAEGSGPVVVHGQLVDGQRPVRVIATVRDDLFGRVASLPELRRFPEQNLYTVRGVEPNAMASIVKGPAQAAGFGLEGGEQVVADAVRILAEDSGALPLVQFALTRWWEERDREARLLTQTEWQKIGGIEGALAEAAQALHDSLAVDERAVMRNLLLALFRHDGTRVRVVESSVVHSDRGRAVLSRLLDRRLVSRYADAEGDATLEVVHEALGRRWPLLHTWLEETRSERELIHDAAYDTDRWRRAGQPNELLWRGRRLAAALLLRDKMAEATAFIDAAARLEERETWTRRGVVGLLAALVAVAVVLGLVYVASNRQRERAKAAQATAEREQGKADEAREQALVALQRNTELLSQAEQAQAQAVEEQRKAREQQRKAEVASREAQREAQVNAELRTAAEQAKSEAVEARNQAQAAMRQAQAEKKEADRQRELNRLAAERAEKQRREAETQRKYAETAQRLHELARRRMERIEAQFDKLKKERAALQEQLDACAGGGSR